MSFRRATVTCLLALFCISAARAESVDVFMDAGNPLYATVDNQPAGVYPALIVEAFARGGIAVHLKALPWRRAMAELDAGKGAVGGIYRTAQRLTRYDYSDVIFVENLHAVVLMAKAAPFGGLESLRGKRLGVLRGWSYGDAFDQARAEGLFIVEEVDGDGQNLAKLKAGRIDVVLANREGAQAAIAASPFSRDFVILEPPFLSIPGYLAFAKHTRSQALLDAFNRGLASMRADGTWERIVRSFLPER